MALDGRLVRMAKPDEIRTILALNCGSSSLKFALFDVGLGVVDRLVEGEAEAVGAANGRFSARSGERVLVDEGRPIKSHAEAATRVFTLLDDSSFPQPSAIGHRIVHGGPTVRRHCLIDAAVMRALEAAQVFAPLHVPRGLEVLRIAQARFAARPHVACLDTAFHHDLPDVARRLPIAVDDVERYGFHGLSCESILRQLGGGAPDRLVIAHLGGGSSITAVKAGRSIDTSMGLTPTGGVMMETRSGDVDPGVLIYLMREKGLDADGLEALVDREGGLAAVSGISGDIRELRRAKDDNARLAIQMYAYAVRKEIAAMTAALQGLDLLVFTGGIGEHDVETRAEICAGLAWFGVLENTPGAPVAVKVLPANEEEQIARHAASLTANITAGGRATLFSL